MPRQPEGQHLHMQFPTFVRYVASLLSGAARLKGERQLQQIQSSGALLTHGNRPA